MGIIEEVALEDSMYEVVGDVSWYFGGDQPCPPDIISNTVVTGRLQEEMCLPRCQNTLYRLGQAAALRDSDEPLPVEVVHKRILVIKRLELAPASLIPIAGPVKKERHRVPTEHVSQQANNLLLQIV